MNTVEDVLDVVSDDNVTIYSLEDDEEYEFDVDDVLEEVREMEVDSINASKTEFGESIICINVSESVKEFVDGEDEEE